MIKVQFLAAPKAFKATPGLKERTFENSGFSVERSLIFGEGQSMEFGITMPTSRTNKKSTKKTKKQIFGFDRALHCEITTISS